MQDVDGYLALRRSLGFRLRETEHVLRSFVRAAVAAHDTHIVSSTAIRWAGLSSSEAERNKRLRTVCIFARFMRAEDSRHEIPPDNVYCGRRPRVAPYIFTDQELRQISRQAQRLGPPGSLPPYTFDTLFSLIAATGMRPSEARNLRLADFSSEGIIVREAKFRKSRFLPLHPSSVASLEAYLERRKQAYCADDHIFISTRGQGFSERRVWNAFFGRYLRRAEYQKDPSRAHLDLWISAILLLCEPLRRAQMAAAVFGSTCSRSAPTWDTATSGIPTGISRTHPS